MPTTTSKIDRERQIVGLMISLYCRHKEGNSSLCDECRHLTDYANARLSRCRYGEGKPTCRRCPIHCYSPAMREKIRRVMRWAGPRMLLYHPLTALKHYIH